MRLAAELARRGSTVDLVVLRPWPEVSVDGNVGVVELRANRMALAVPELVRYIRRSRPVAILSAEDHANVVSLLAARASRANVKVGVTCHVSFRYGARPPWHKGFWITKLMSWLYPTAQCVGTVSAGLGDELASVIDMPRTAIKTIYNPVVTAEISERMSAPSPHAWLVPGSVPVVCAMGVLRPSKGFDVLIRAFALLSAEREVRLMIVGEGPERSRLEALARELGVAEKFCLVGAVANPFSYIARSQLFALSSRVEALPTVLIEALACGVPVVATDCAHGPREILEDGRYGALVPVEDAAALASAMSKTMDDPPSAANLERRGMDFTAESAVDAYLEHLDIELRRSADGSRPS
jgi:glycosyltransferase involved in cell wall biosynthesis